MNPVESNKIVNADGSELPSNYTAVEVDNHSPNLWRIFKKLVKIFCLIVLVIIALVVCTILITSLMRNREINKQAKDAAYAVTSSRLNAEQAGDDNLIKIVSLAKNKGLIVHPLGSSKVDVCYVTHQDVGFLSSSYYQDCYLRYVQGYDSGLTADKIKQALLISSNSQPALDDAVTTNANYDCLVDTKFITDIEKEGELIFIPENVNSNILDEYTCKVPSPLRGEFSIRGPVVLDNELAVKTYKSFDQTRINRGTNQLWVSFDKHYYHEELGCGTGALCNNPRPKPVQAP